MANILVSKRVVRAIAAKKNEECFFFRDMRGQLYFMTHGNPDGTFSWDMLVLDYVREHDVVVIACFPRAVSAHYGVRTVGNWDCPTGVDTIRQNVVVTRWRARDEYEYANSPEMGDITYSNTIVE